MVGPFARRKVVECLKTEQCFSERHACRMVGVARSGLRYQPQGQPGEATLRKEVRHLARQHPRYGCLRITALLRQKGLINKKRVHRIWKLEGLSLPRRRPKRRHHLGSNGVCRKPQRPNEVWSYDFLEDRTVRGGRLRLLCVLDEYTRECLSIRVERSMGSTEVIQMLEWLFLSRGVPAYIRSDNGPEFIAQKLKQWLAENNCGTLYIEPGSPWENGYLESFNGKLRDECLNREIFSNGQEARTVVEQWRKEYNEQRPHSALGYVPPAQFARRAWNLLRPTAFATSTQQPVQEAIL
jgi:transposase InsO family protein